MVREANQKDLDGMLELYLYLHETVFRKGMRNFRRRGITL